MHRLAPDILLSNYTRVVVSLHILVSGLVYRYILKFRDLMKTALHVQVPTMEYTLISRAPWLNLMENSFHFLESHNNLQKL